MKNSLKTLIAVLLLAFSISYSKAQPKAKIGMSIDQVKKLYPNSTSTFNQSNAFIESETIIYGLEEKWGFKFKDGKVDMMSFHYYDRQFNEEKFSNFLLAAQNLIEDYKKAFGEPDIVEIGDTTYKDPDVKRHWGYKVIEAKWRNADEMKCKIEFKFLGGKGQYCLLFKVIFFDKEYAYFD